MNNIDVVKTVFNDAEVFKVDAQYEDFHAIVDGVRMIFYSHTVKSTSNAHVRVRNGTPKRKGDFLELVSILQISQPNQNNFPVKNHHMLYLPRFRNKPLRNKDYKNYLVNAKNMEHEDRGL